MPCACPWHQRISLDGLTHCVPLPLLLQLVVVAVGLGALCTAGALALSPPLSLSLSLVALSLSLGAFELIGRTRNAAPPGGWSRTIDSWGSSFSDDFRWRRGSRAELSFIVAIVACAAPRTPRSSLCAPRTPAFVTRGKIHGRPRVLPLARRAVPEDRRRGGGGPAAAPAGRPGGRPVAAQPERQRVRLPLPRHERHHSPVRPPRGAARAGDGRGDVLAHLRVHRPAVCGGAPAQAALHGDRRPAPWASAEPAALAPLQGGEGARREGARPTRRCAPRCAPAAAAREGARLVRLERDHAGHRVHGQPGAVAAVLHPAARLDVGGVDGDQGDPLRRVGPRRGRAQDHGAHPPAAAAARPTTPTSAT